MRPASFDTLVDLLDFRRRESPADPAFWFGGTAHSFAWLWDRVEAAGYGLVAAGVRAGDRVVMAFPNGPDFFVAFYGILRAGAIAVPIFPASGIERLSSIAAACEASRILLPDSAGPGKTAALHDQGLHLEDLRAGARGRFPDVRPEDVAYIQYTSGSTGNPKGVVLSHANLLTNVSQMIEGMGITRDDVFVSWLPAYHDMGLVLMTMAPFAVGASLHLLPADLRSVRPWLTTLHRVRATFTTSPDFGYRLMMRQAAVESGLDLRPLRVALNAAEPVRATTLQRFHEAFGLTDVMVAGYGLAEATVGVSMWPPGQPNAIDDDGRVSAGKPFPGIEILIADGTRLLRPGEQGEILVRSPANSLGYYNNPEETNRLRGPADSIRTGDIGYLDGEANLFIVGRSKEILKVGGETFAPEEIEEASERVPGVRAAAAVGIDRGSAAGEQIYIFAEVRGAARATEAMEATVVGIAEAVHQRLGRRPGRVYLTRTLPRTPNGKLQRGLLREQYLDGTLRREAALLFPEY